MVGINYWPRSSAMYMWSLFNIDEIRKDFKYIASLGLQTVRFFLNWEEFQPQPNVVQAGTLRKLKLVMDALHDEGLQGMPTFFSGHMSGVNWLPEWTLDPKTPSGRFRTISAGKENPYGIGDFYTGALLEAQRFQVRAVADHLQRHPALYAWDLGNEFSNLREPRSPADAAYWSAELSDELKSHSNADVTGGIHGEDISRDRNIRPSSICVPWAYATMHGYSVYSSFARGANDCDVVPYLSAITASCANKRVLFSEFGNPTCPPGTVSPADRIALPGEEPISARRPANAAAFACLTEEQMGEYAYAVLGKLHALGALGALWWCYADYNAALRGKPPFDRAPHELTFGIVGSDGTPKPVAKSLRAFASEKRRVEPNKPPIAEETAYYTGLPQTLTSGYAHFLARQT